MAKIAVVGFGFMGRMHFRCWRDIEGAEVTAICEANPEVISSATKPAGNIEGAADEIDLTGITIYDDYDKMLAEADIDAVSITLPSFLPADFAAKALEKGISVLCEKPMALTIEECDRMVAAADASGKALMVAHCIRFWPEYAKVKEIIDGGEYGEVRAATFRRLGAAPTWAAGNWFFDKSKSGGMPVDLHVHDADFVHYLFGIPQKVTARAARLENGMPCHMVADYDYGDNKVVTAEASWMMTDSFGFEMSFDICLEKAVLVFDPSRDPAFRVCPAEGDAFTPEVAAGDGYSQEIAHFLRVVNGEEELNVVTPMQSRETMRLVLAEVESMDSGSPVAL